MVYKCCAPGCRGNYDKTGPKVSTFKFPDDNNLRAKWLNFIKREKDFIVTKHTRLCEQHFKPSDIIKFEKIFDPKKGVFVDNVLLHPRVKPGVVPSFLPGCPEHCSKIVSDRKSREEKLKEKEDEALLQCIADSIETHQQYEKEKKFSNFNEFCNGLKKNGDWSDWSIVHYENEVVFVTFTRSPIMKVMCSVVINSKCDVEVFDDVTELEKFRTKLNDFNQFEKLLSEVRLQCGVKSGKSSCGDNESVESRVKNYIFVIESMLLKIKELVSDEDKQKAIYYLIEQVKFLSISRYKYHYSVEVMVLSSIFLSISPHAYRFVRSSKILVLPHPKTIYKVCAKYNHLDPLNEQNDDQFLTYVKERFNQLQEKERVVMLLMDEIHVKPFLDYKAGNIVGAAFNSNDVAKTAYVFMLKSFRSSFKEVAHILPVRTITAEQLHSFIMKLLKGLDEIGYKVLTIISDNNAINSKAISFFTTPPRLEIFYPHPYAKDIRLFFLFDSVHILKCIRNNWLNKKDDEKTIICPPFDVNPDNNTKDKECVATFNAIRTLYRKEEHKLIKYAYTLNYKSLYPSNLERQNVRLVLNVFNDFVRQGLLKYDDILNSSSTANFIEVVVNWWSIVNTKTLFKGVRHRNELESPLAVDNAPYKYLKKFLNWLLRWKNLDQTSSLTRETMTAVIQTTDGLLQLCDYCTN